ncbi:MAG: hypothetical protein WA919_25225 [Coleofasciculaceae cyanobacterium]
MIATPGLHRACCINLKVIPDKDFNRFFAQTSARFWHRDAQNPGIFEDVIAESSSLQRVETVPCSLFPVPFPHHETY